MNSNKNVINFFDKNIYLCLALSICGILKTAKYRKEKVMGNEAGEWNRKFKLVYHKNKFLTPAIFELEKILHTYQQLELPSVMGVLEQE